MAQEHPTAPSPAASSGHILQLPRLLVRYARLNGPRPMPFPLSLLLDANALGYLRWPRKCSRWVSGADVLDIGCGRSYHSVGFLFAGARSYSGLDPTLDPDGATVKDPRGVHSTFVASRWTPRELMRRVRGVELHRTDLEGFRTGRRFDAVVMHNVTEHLRRIEQDFARIDSLLRPNGYLIFCHPNYYSWGGHHMRPRIPAEIVPGDPDQAKYMDWAHARPHEDWPRAISHNQNRIRLIDLFRLTSTLFRIEQWQEKALLPAEGSGRLTPEIRARYPELTDQDFLTKYVICVAQKRGK